MKVERKVTSNVSGPSAFDSGEKRKIEWTQNKSATSASSSGGSSHSTYSSSGSSSSGSSTGKNVNYKT